MWKNLIAIMVGGGSCELIEISVSKRLCGILDATQAGKHLYGERKVSKAGSRLRGGPTAIKAGWRLSHPAFPGSEDFFFAPNFTELHIESASARMHTYKRLGRNLLQALPQRHEAIAVGHAPK